MAEGNELAVAYVSLAVSGQGLRGDVDKMLGQATKGQGEKQGRTLGGTLAGGFKKAAVGGFAGAGLIAGAALTKGFGRLKSLDDARGKLEGLGHSTKVVDGIMQDALKSVKGTAFGMDDAASGAAGMVASGIKPGKELTKTLTLVGDAATIAGTDFNSMSSIFGKAAATNKVQGDILAQLGDQGIPVLQFLSKEMGVSAEEVSKLASAGKVDFKTFQSAMETGLGGAAQKSGETFTGSLKNAGAALGRLGASLLGGVFPQLKGGLGGVTDLFDRMGPTAEVWGQKIGVAIGFVSDRVGAFAADFKAGDGAAGTLRRTLEGFVGFVTGTAVPAVKSFAGWVRDNKETLLALGGALLAGVVALKAFMFIKTVIVAVKAARAAMLAFNLTMLANPIGILVVAIAALVGGLIYLYRNNDKARAIMQAAWAKIKQAIGFVAAWIKNVAWPMIQTVFKAIGAVVKWLWSSVIKPYIGFMWAYWKTVFGFLKTWVWPVVKDAFSKIAAIAKWLWNNAIKPAFRSIWGNAKTVFGWIKNTGWPWIRNAFQAIGDKAKWLWDKGVKTPLNRMKAGFTALKDAAIRVKDAISKQFGKIRDGIQKPLRQIMTFIDKKFISKVKGMLHGVGLGSLSKQIPYLTPNGKGYAKGGILPGYTPMRQGDDVLTPMRSGEGVMVSEGLRDSRSRSMFLAANAAAKRGTSFASFLGQGYAKGGIVDLGKRIQKMGYHVSEHPAFGGVVPGAHSANGYHYKSGALDVNADPFNSSFKSEGPALDKLNGILRGEGWNTIWRAANHFDHLHVDVANGQKGGVGGLVSGMLSGFAGKVMDGGKKTLTDILGGLPGAGSFWGKTAIAPMKMVAGGVFDKFKAAASMMDGGGDDSGVAPGKGVERWRPTVLRALGILGMSDKYANSTLRRMMQESGGNPRAINNWDSNASRGTPSKGLMQVIDPTFRAYARQGYSKDIYDPLSNILASMRYAVATYGNLFNAYDRKGGYSGGGIVTPPVFDNGGTLAPGLNLVNNKLGKPEALVRPEQMSRPQVNISFAPGTEWLAEFVQSEITYASDFDRAIGRAV